MSHRISRSLAVLSLAALLAACGSSVKLDQPAAATPVERKPAAATPVTPAAPAPATATGVPQSQVTTVDLARQRAAAGGGTAAAPGAAAGGSAPPVPVALSPATAATAAAAAAAAAAVPAERIVYFDFDSFTLRDEFNPLLEGHARYLGAGADRRLVIEGHTDERGGREYNLALGQKRAEAVLRALALLGVDEKRLEAVSFGKERPAAEGSNEAAWAKNRRAELKDR